MIKLSHQIRAEWFFICIYLITVSVQWVFFLYKYIKFLKFIFTSYAEKSLIAILEDSSNNSAYQFWYFVLKIFFLILKLMMFCKIIFYFAWNQNLPIWLFYFLVVYISLQHIFLPRTIQHHLLIQNNLLHLKVVYLVFSSGLKSRRTDYLKFSSSLYNMLY